MNKPTMKNAAFMRIAINCLHRVVFPIKQTTYQEEPHAK